MRYNWRNLNPNSFEEMTQALILEENPSATILNGSGGDGGREAEYRDKDNKLHMFQAKFFIDGFKSSQKTQMKKSLSKASKLKPHSYTFILPIERTPAMKTWFEKLQSEYPAIILYWWGHIKLTTLLNQHKSVVSSFFEDVAEEVLEHSKLYDLQHKIFTNLSDASPRIESVLKNLNNTSAGSNHSFSIDKAGHVRIRADFNQDMSLPENDIDIEANPEAYKAQLNALKEFGIPVRITPEDTSLVLPQYLKKAIDGYNGPINISLGNKKQINGLFELQSGTRIMMTGIWTMGTAGSSFIFQESTGTITLVIKLAVGDNNVTTISSGRFAINTDYTYDTSKLEDLLAIYQLIKTEIATFYLIDGSDFFKLLEGNIELPVVETVWDEFIPSFLSWLLLKKEEKVEGKWLYNEEIREYFQIVQALLNEVPVTVPEEAISSLHIEIASGSLEEAEEIINLNEKKIYNYEVERLFLTPKKNTLKFPTFTINADYFPKKFVRQDEKLYVLYLPQGPATITKADFVEFDNLKYCQDLHFLL